MLCPERGVSMQTGRHCSGTFYRLNMGTSPSHFLAAFEVDDMRAEELKSVSGDDDASQRSDLLEFIVLFVAHMDSRQRRGSSVASTADRGNPPPPPLIRHLVQARG